MVKQMVRWIIGFLLLTSFSCNPSQVYQVEIVTPTKKIVHPIHHNTVITVQGKISEMIVEIFQNRVRILEANCPDQICIKTGWISQAHEFILCAPNQVIVRIIRLPGSKNRFITY